MSQQDGSGERVGGGCEGQEVDRGQMETRIGEGEKGKVYALAADKRVSE